MSSKRKTPARKKTTTATSPVSTLEAVSAAPLAEQVPAPALAEAPLPPQAVTLPPQAVTLPPQTAARESAPLTAPRAAQPGRLSLEDRHRMIARLAYGYAEMAGFRNNPVDDWLLAEREVDATLQRLAS